MESDTQKGQALIELVIFASLLAVSLLLTLPNIFSHWEREMQAASLTKER